MALILSLPSRQMHILTFLNPDVRMCVIICNAGVELEIDVNSSDKTGMGFFFFSNYEIQHQTSNGYIWTIRCL